MTDLSEFSYLENGISYLDYELFLTSHNMRRSKPNFKNDFKKLLTLLELGANPNIIINNHTVFDNIIGEFEGKELSDVVKLLCKYGAQPTTDSLMIAIFHSNEPLIKLLIENGVNVNKLGYDDDFGYVSPLRYACICNCKLPIIKLLVENGAKITKRIIDREEKYNVKEYLKRVHAMQSVLMGTNQMIKRGQLEYFPPDLIRKIGHAL